MNSITLDGVTFRWDGQDLLVTTAASQKRLTGRHECAPAFGLLVVDSARPLLGRAGARFACMGPATTTISEWAGER